MRRRDLVSAGVLSGSSYICSGQATTVFHGTPLLKISEGGTERAPESLSRERAANLGCVISVIGKDHYWASRENKGLVRRENGAFVTFIAVDGSGYVRIVNPRMKSEASSMGPTETEFDYVEHLLIGLRSVTYYGIAA